MLNVPAMEQIVMIAIGFFVLVLVSTRGIDRLLRWMDDHDWIVVPNRDAARNSDRFANLFIELQSVAEPAKRQIIKKKDADKVKREEDEQGEGPPPTPGEIPPPTP